MNQRDGTGAQAETAEIPRSEARPEAPATTETPAPPSAASASTHFSWSPWSSPATDCWLPIVLGIYLRLGSSSRGAREQVLAIYLKWGSFMGQKHAAPESLQD